MTPNVNIDKATLYEEDFCLWLETTAELLKNRQLENLDYDNLIEEIETMGRSERNSLKSNLVVVLMHLLKYKYQPQKRSKSWLSSIFEHRRRLIEADALTILELGIRISTLIFILIYSTNLYLLTTAPEEITAGLDDLLSPLRRFNIPITEILLTLTLSLRFISLVLEEVQNLIRSIRTRAINWKKLGIKRSLQVWLVVVEKLLENLLMRAEEIAIAMEIRGFLSPNKHRVEWHQLRLIRGDWLALGLLIIFWYGRLRWGNM